MQRLIFILLLIGITSCGDKEDRNEKGKYFDLKSFFKEQVQNLSLTNTHIRKQIVAGNTKEEKTFLDVDWEKELRPFSESDINKAAWKLSYSIDTFYLQSQCNIVFKAKEPKLPVRKLELILHADTIAMIKIETEKQNSYYHSIQNLIFEVGKGYTISGGQKVILADSTNYKIKAEFFKE